MKALELSGKRYGRLLAIERSENRGRCVTWLCQCDCGNTCRVRLGDLNSGDTKSCGCAYMKHGYSTRSKPSPTFACWRHMKDRCFKPTTENYKYYGGRGITICDRWLKFENFLADMGERPDGLSIDRINNDGDYEPDNCRWATPKQQVANQRKRKTGFKRRGPSIAMWL